MELYNNSLVYVALFFAVFFIQIIWIKSAPMCSLIEKRKLSPRLTEFIFCACTALAVSTLFRLFPGNDLPPNEDSSVFLYIGERMLEGKVPYRDLFDHKGLLLYFIQFLGLKIASGSFSGIWILEAVNMLITALLMCRLGSIITDNRASVYLAVIMTIGVCGWKVWQGGNFTEEYALPWITLAAVVFLSFFQKKKYRKTDVLLLGIGFAAVFLLRANMIAAWISFLPAVLVFLIIKKRFVEIGECVLFFLVGMVIIFLPALFYLLRTDSLEAFWKTYFLFNLSYTEASHGGILKTAVYFASVIWPGALAVFICLITDPRKKLQWFNALFFIVSLYTAAMSGREYYHYAIVLLPTLVLPMTGLFDLTANMLPAGEAEKITVSPTVMLISSVLIMTTAFTYRELSSREEELDPIVQYLRESTKETDDVLILGNSCWYYLMADRKTENRFFYQLPPLEISDELYTSFLKEIEKKPSQMIILPGVMEERESIDLRLHRVRETLMKNKKMNYNGVSYEQFEVFTVS